MIERITKNLWVAFFAVLVAVVAVNLLSPALALRFDATEEGLYTLSKGSKQIAQKLENPVTLKLYFSKSLSGVPLQVKHYGQAVEELLKEFVRLNPSQISLEIYDPKPDTDEEEWADKFGLSGADLPSGGRFFMGLAALSEGQEKVIPFFDPRREEFLEYDLSELLLGFTKPKRVKVGIISSLPIMGINPGPLQQMQGAQPQPAWAFVEELKKTSELVELHPEEPVPADVTRLIVMHPKHLSPRAEYEIDQFVLGGGELVLLVDPYARMDEQARAMAQFNRGGPQAGSDLPRLLQHWGIEYSANQILGDLEHPSQVNAGGGMAIPFALWHSLDPGSFTKELAATKGLEQMLLVEPGGFKVKKDSPLKYVTLIQSSQKGGMVDTMALQFTPPTQLNQQVADNPGQWQMAGIFTGEVTSAFLQIPEAPKPKEGEPAPAPRPHLEKSQKPTRILLITDVDFLHDNYSVQVIDFLGQRIVRPLNDNLVFFVNMMDFLSGSEELMSIRSRGRFSRPFTKFEELAAQASGEYRRAEQELNQKLRQVQQHLTELDHQKQGGQAGLSPEQLEKIKEFRAEEKKTKASLRKIRQLLRQDIENLQQTLTLANLLVVPLLLVFAGGLIYRRRFS
ncbi:MAG: hypothetical protein A2508_05795 [Candidatus Lambdaproteobacteria bacterium RIFOXYD12_FULL_49_8]|uniref:Uncharacterized protein n=1 Tax=Candidatus Lambdaproteobacteria bacterium RIFOXYD2_FULL_50_16 TaxID=1817772 RepID=A0A1F6GFV2_9PROT|nr:MAG: hypothetical protein A2527_02715 [Candidatus Lambdaproteobacteria bacterium RIFOXYD2_FULL_50_16]OGG98054.1 MAG: hypothetical protein A2508_05795 [Candidatus Lambdaproteobacteria bacterium RIFOXYD12_FULL_49_8]